MSRIILHSDANSFYASVEMLLNPSLRDKAVAVCGCVEDRHGIVLAKSEKAKKAGVKTGQANWQATQVCPNLITVPPQYDQYVKFSKLLRNIYLQYTDLVEPFGMDECWLDVTGSQGLFGSGESIAEDVRQRIKSELGITVSIGVSFNKVFAKLGSDMKKPDAITVLDEEHWRERIWPLPVSELLYIGPATTRKLLNRAVCTVGDLAKIPLEYLCNWFGKNGLMLWAFANGEDVSRVMFNGYESPIKSVGHGITCTCDLQKCEDVWRVILELSQNVGHRLRLHGFAATGVRLGIRGSDLNNCQYQTQLRLPSQSPFEIARAVYELFQQRYRWMETIRAITVTAINLVPSKRPIQIDMFGEAVRNLRQQKIDDCIDGIRNRFGNHSIIAASLMGDLHMPNDGRHKVKMPGMMYV